MLLTCLNDTCQSYMWVVGNFLQTNLLEISVQNKILLTFSLPLYQPMGKE
jgi:hypothetical protein